MWLLPLRASDGNYGNETDQVFPLKQMIHFNLKLIVSSDLVRHFNYLDRNDNNFSNLLN